jgi:hypothetical protein
LIQISRLSIAGFSSCKKKICEFVILNKIQIQLLVESLTRSSICEIESFFTKSCAPIFEFSIEQTTNELNYCQSGDKVFVLDSRI